MTDEGRLTLQLATNILGAGFVMIFGFSQFGEYLIDHHWRHVFAALAWWVLVPVMILRTAAVMQPPLLPAQVIMDGTTIGWAVCLIFGILWGVLRTFEARNDRDARRRLGLDTKDEGENEL